MLGKIPGNDHRDGARCERLRLASRHARSRNLALVDRRHHHPARLRRARRSHRHVPQVRHVEEVRAGLIEASARVGRPLIDSCSNELMIADLLRRTTFPAAGHGRCAVGCPAAPIRPHSYDLRSRPVATSPQYTSTTACGRPPTTTKRAPGHTAEHLGVDLRCRTPRADRRPESRGQGTRRPPTGARARGTHRPHRRRSGRDAAPRPAPRFRCKRSRRHDAGTDATDPRRCGDRRPWRCASPRGSRSPTIRRTTTPGSAATASVTSSSR